MNRLKMHDLAVTFLMAVFFAVGLTSVASAQQTATPQVGEGSL